MSTSIHADCRLPTSLFLGLVISACSWGNSHNDEVGRRSSNPSHGCVLCPHLSLCLVSCLGLDINSIFCIYIACSCRSYLTCMSAESSSPCSEVHMQTITLCPSYAIMLSREWQHPMWTWRWARFPHRMTMTGLHVREMREIGQVAETLRDFIF